MRNTSRGFASYAMILVVVLVVALLLSNGLSPNNSRKISYATLLEMISNNQVEAVAIRGTSLVGLMKNSQTAPGSFPERAYDFETTIGENFIETARQMIAAQRGKPVAEVSEKDLPFDVIYREPLTRSIWADLLPTLILVGVIMVGWMFIMRSQANGNSKVMNFGKSSARIQRPDENKITFADVAGADEEKEELQEMVDFLRSPQSYTDLGARIPKGVLLVGPPGTGKTLLARAVAGEAGVPFFSISGSDFVEMFVGVGASRVRDLFEQAKKSAPSIVFIDEIDAVGRHRGAGLGGGHDEREQTLNQLLVEMDGFSVNTGVIVMAATNRRDILDPALLRPGRFDRQVTVNYPDQDGRVAILKVHSKGKPLAEDVDLDNVGKRMPFATGADLENVMNEAAILAARGRQTVITQQNLIDAIERVQMGPEKKSHKVHPLDEHLVAVHEGGHAVVGHFLPGCDEVHTVTILPRGQSGGHTLALPEEERDSMSRTQMMDTVCMLLAGHAAEELILGEVYTGSSSDLKRATELTRRMVTQFGMSPDLGTIYLASDQEVFVGMEFGQSREYSEEMAARIDAEVKRLLDECYERTKAVIREHEADLQRLVQRLKEEKTINRAEFVSLMSPAVQLEKPAYAADEA